MVKRMVTAIYVESLETSKTFYYDLLGLVPSFETDWIIQLSSPDNKALELILQPKNHELIPSAFQTSPQGSSIAFVIDDCDEFYSKALSMGLKIIQEPKNEAYGQRRFLTLDPDGLLIDVSSECEPSAEFMAKYMS